MSLETMRIWTESTVISAMNQSYPGVPIKFPNARFTQPETIWTLLQIINGSSFGTNLGSHKVDRHVGIIQFDVLAPEHSGSSQPNQIAEFVGNLLRNRSVGLDDGARVLLRQPAYKPWGFQSGFYRMTMSIGFWRDEPAS